ncbi:MAG: thioredoxin [Chloroflexi bacterium]|nr:thioredoxin [Chloroflexota bacterium]
MTSILKKLFGKDAAHKKDVASTQARAAATPGRKRAEPIHVTDADFDKVVLEAGKLAIVDLWAEWCAPCHMLAPTIEELADEYDGQLLVAKLNVDDNPVTAARFRIMGIPTVLFFKDGQEIDRIVGVQSYAAFANKIERYL